MKKFLRLSAIFVLAAALMPLSANSQEQKKEQPAKAAPAARGRTPLSGPGGMLVESWPLRQRGRRSRST